MFVFIAVLSTLYTPQVFSDTFYSIYCLVIKLGRSRSPELGNYADSIDYRWLQSGSAGLVWDNILETCLVPPSQLLPGPGRLASGNDYDTSFRLHKYE